MVKRLFLIFLMIFSFTSCNNNYTNDEEFRINQSINDVYLKYQFDDSFVKLDGYVFLEHNNMNIIIKHENDLISKIQKYDIISSNNQIFETFNKNDSIYDVVKKVGLPINYTNNIKSNSLSFLSSTYHEFILTFTTINGELYFESLKNVSKNCNNHIVKKTKSQKQTCEQIGYDYYLCNECKFEFKKYQFLTNCNYKNNKCIDCNNIRIKSDDKNYTLTFNDKSEITTYVANTYKSSDLVAFSTNYYDDLSVEVKINGNLITNKQLYFNGLLFYFIMPCEDVYVEIILIK